MPTAVGCTGGITEIGVGVKEVMMVVLGKGRSEHASRKKTVITRLPTIDFNPFILFSPLLKMMFDGGLSHIVCHREQTIARLSLRRLVTFLVLREV
jgi:hypothetical protein